MDKELKRQIKENLKVVITPLNIEVRVGDQLLIDFLEEQMTGGVEYCEDPNHSRCSIKKGVWYCDVCGKPIKGDRRLAEKGFGIPVKDSDKAV